METTSRSLRPDLPLPPLRMRSRPVDHRGYPVPWFVTEQDEKGNWEFRVVTKARVAQAIRQTRCWTCGEQLGRYRAFVIGPMCVVNRVSGDPPSHKECAEFAVRACPFMARPLAQRRAAGLDEEVRSGAFTPGISITRNPGVSVIYVTRKYDIERASSPNGAVGVLFKLGEPSQVQWYREGRRAERVEVQHAIDTGLPILREQAEKDGPDALVMLDGMVKVALKYLPEAEEAARHA